MGWEHMNDHDPQSLNDDYIRTFTISSTPPEARNGVENRTKIEITMRKHGPATSLLWGTSPRAELTIPVLGFGGEDKFLLPTTKTEVTSVFIAGGVGITPLIAQAKGVFGANNPLRVLWSLRGEDLPLAVDTFTRIPELASRTRIFVTGREVQGQSEIQEKLKSMGTEISAGRITHDAVLVEKGAGRKFFVCAGDGVMKLALGWLGGEDVVFESFLY
jgi:ferredoxin-NADP reductase